MKPYLRITLAAALSLWITSAVAQEAIGVIKRTHGPVTIDRAGEQLPAVRGAQLRAGDRVVTGKNGHVDITMRGNAVSVGPDATVGLDRYAPAPNQAQTAPFSLPPFLQGLASFFTLNRHR